MLPAELAKHGLLTYSEEVKRVISQGELLVSGGREEVEIRAATIVVCDLIAMTWDVPPMMVNDVLWLSAGETFADSPSHHRTWTEAN